MIDAQDVAIFKSQKDYVRNKQKLLEYMLCTNVAGLVGHILLCSLYMQHNTCDNTDCILY